MYIGRAQRHRDNRSFEHVSEWVCDFTSNQCIAQNNNNCVHFKLRKRKIKIKSAWRKRKKIHVAVIDHSLFSLAVSCECYTSYIIEGMDEASIILSGKLTSKEDLRRSLKWTEHQLWLLLLLFGAASCTFIKIWQQKHKSKSIYANQMASVHIELWSSQPPAIMSFLLL